MPEGCLFNIGSIVHYIRTDPDRRTATIKALLVLLLNGGLNKGKDILCVLITHFSGTIYRMILIIAV